MNLPAVWANTCLRKNGLARTDSVLAYGQRGWRCERADVGTEQTPDSGTVKVKT